MLTLKWRHPPADARSEGAVVVEQPPFATVHRTSVRDRARLRLGAGKAATNKSPHGAEVTRRRE
jgi:hypothetical protein